MTLITIVWAAVAVIISLVPLLLALHRQTVRADRAEAALARVEATIRFERPTGRLQAILDDMRKRASAIE
jgi:hypothetical protein